MTEQTLILNRHQLDLQIAALRDENLALRDSLKRAERRSQKFNVEAFHNQVMTALLNERFNPSQNELPAIQQQSRFLQSLATLCHSQTVSIYRFNQNSGYFHLESFYSRFGRRPQKQFVAADPASYLTNNEGQYCNFAISPMRYAVNCNDIHWFYDQRTKRAILMSFDDSYALQQQTFANISSGILRMALHLYEEIETNQQAKDKLTIQATMDPMTGLPNRTLAFDRLSQAMRSRLNEEKLVFALFIDIAHFKDVNEAFGHDTGDRLLEILASRIRVAVRDSDTVARLSGDEFLVILENANKAKAAEVVAKNIINAISAPLCFQGRELLMASNIGISAFPSDGSDASSLIKNADAAMYQARKMGVNQFQFYTQAMNEEVAQRLAIENGLHKALQHNEFTLNYQPLVDLANGSTVIVEALIRWHSADLGFVPPNDFITIAEEDGLIVPIGYWVIEEVCRQINIWKSQGINNLTVAINLSVRQLQEPGFINRLMQILSEHQVNTNKIELEITEGILISQADGADNVLSQLHLLGFKLSLDDFGTGYSALSYLNNYHFDYLKIDRSFITNLVRNDKDKALIDAIVAMAHKLNLKVIAEGVEHIEELNYLQSQNCDYIQGFYFSKPLPAAQISERYFSATKQIA